MGWRVDRLLHGYPGPFLLLTGLLKIECEGSESAEKVGQSIFSCGYLYKREKWICDWVFLMDSGVRWIKKE